MLRALLTLLAVPGRGRASVWPCLGNHEALLAECAALPPADRDRAQARADAVIAQCHRVGIGPLLAGEEGYPRGLLQLPDPPPVLFTLGNRQLLEAPAVAVVGSRSATAYGLRIARRIAGDLASRGIVVVSGLAFGIDAAAHEAALSSARTIAVMGTGVDVPYPKEHVELHGRVGRRALLVSERPPGARAHAGSFPKRNRLIAALADVTVVVEAGLKSGALITARIAGEIGRAFGAVPGPVDVAQSQGTNALLRDGAHTITSADDVASLLALVPRGRGRTDGGEVAPGTCAASSASSFERKVLDVLRAGPRLTDELAGAASMAPRDVLVALASLELLGLARVEPSGLVVAL